MTVVGSDVALCGSNYDRARRGERKQCAAELRDFCSMLSGHVDSGVIEWLLNEADRMEFGASPLTYAELVSCGYRKKTALEGHIQEVD